jgi:hypothetical protein
VILTYFTENISPSVTSLAWTVQTTKNLTVSNMFFLSIFLEGDTTSEANSYYFNITSQDEASPTSGASSWTTTTTSPIQLSSTSGAISTSTTSPTSSISSMSSSSTSTASPTPSSSGSIDLEKNSNDNSDSTSQKVGLGVGLGLGIPLFLIAITLVGWQVIRQQNLSSPGYDAKQPVTSAINNADPEPPTYTPRYHPYGPDSLNNLVELGTNLDQTTEELDELGIPVRDLVNGSNVHNRSWD